MRSVDRSTRQAPPVNLADFEAPARALLPRSSYDYFAGGAEDEATVAANREAFARWRFRYRTLAGAASPQLGGQLLGDPVAMPVHLAPTATQKLAHPDGELAAVRAAASAGVVYCLSTLSTTSMEEVAKAGGNCWFQLYIYKDRGITRSLVNRAESCGFRAIVVTVDAPVLGRRERDLRNGFSLPGDLRYENLVDALSHTEDAGPGHSGLAGYFNAQLDPSLTWKDLEWICGLARVPVLAKGLVRSDDAQKALDSGARGVIVSNHGGRQLDHSVASLDALPEVAGAVARKAPVLMDGGVRRGTDVLKALALGADGVLVGRPLLWALATDGEAGVRHMLRLVLDELAAAMTLLGISRLEELTSDYLVRV